MPLGSRNLCSALAGACPWVRDETSRRELRWHASSSLYRPLIFRNDAARRSLYRARPRHPPRVSNCSKVIFITPSERRVATRDCETRSKPKVSSWNLAAFSLSGTGDRDMSQLALAHIVLRFGSVEEVCFYRRGENFLAGLRCCSNEARDFDAIEHFRSWDLEAFRFFCCRIR